MPDLAQEVDRLSGDCETCVFEVLHELERLSLLVAEGIQNQPAGLELLKQLQEHAWSMRTVGDQLQFEALRRRSSFISTMVPVTE
jgi:hypothetical protein